MSDIFDLDAYDYVLPDFQIAQQPHEPADECKIMIVDRAMKTIEHKVFRDAILHQLDSDYVLLFNNSKVVRARIPLESAVIWYGDISVAGIQGELFYLGSVGDGCHQFMVKPGSKLKKGTIVMLGNNKLSIVDDFDYGRIIHYEGDIFSLLEAYGQMPLPPYVEYNQKKEADYQPVVAKEPGSVASPTASLHFTSRLLNELKNKPVLIDYVTLHVGIGTFRPIKTKNINDFQIHSEQCQVDLALFERIMNYKLNNKKIVAVGTTSCRTLESLPYVFLASRNELSSLLSPDVFDFWDTLSNKKLHSSVYVDQIIINKETIGFACVLYIVPGFQFCVIDQLITNFHLPKSSLMVLLASFMGHEFMMQAYAQAIEKNYLFYSFGDAMRVQ